MKLISVNVSQPKPVTTADGTTVMTGIFKEPVPGPVLLRRLNLEGDRQADLTVHGGADKALYAYPVEHYSYWQRVLNVEQFRFGQFGENLTIAGLTEDTVRIGDVYRIRQATVQVTQPRVPCYKLGLKFQIPAMPKLFLASARSGFYLRVLQEGSIGAGDPIERIQSDPRQLTVRQVFALAFFDKDNVELIRKAVAIPSLSDSWREMFEERLSTVLPGRG